MQATLARPGLLEFRLLGPLEAFAHGAPLLLGGPKEQAVLASLVLRARSVVSAEALIEAVWDEDPPRSAAKNVQTYVSQIRRQLRAAGAEAALVTRASGYELLAAPEDVDVGRFESGLDSARSVGGSGAPAQALELLQDALGLWRGDALAGVRSSRTLAAEAARLDELHLLALEERNAVELALGRHARLVGRLAAQVMEHPLRERLWEQLVLALYRCGRQADALGAYQRARTCLIDELGLEPGPELRRLEARVLAQDPALAAPEAPVVLHPPPVEALPAELVQPASPLVGRAADLREVEQAWVLARTGRTSIVLIAGEPGIGKTRLSGAAATQAASEGARVLYGRCDPETLIPFQPLVEALRRYVRVAPLPLLRQHLLDSSGQLRRLLPELAQRLPDLAESLPPPGDERYLLFDAVAALLTAAARREPLVLVLDDLHWADAATLLLVRHIARVEDVPLLVLATYRDSEVGRSHPLAESLAMLRRSSSVRRLRLVGVDATGVAEIARGVLGRAAHADALATQIQAETDGNPLFVHEVLRHLAESDAGPTLEHGLAIPEGVREIIGRRLARLSDPANRLLTVGAVAGREFDLSLVAQATELDEDATLAAADEAVAAQLLREVPAHVDRYSFSHALVRATLYDELTASRRVRLHRRLAAVLEQAEARQPRTHLAHLVHHLVEAAQREDVDRAVTYARRAAEVAMEQLAYEDAARLYRKALDVLELADGPELVRRTELLLELAAAVARTDPAAAREIGLQAATSAREARSPHLLARAAIAVTGSGAGTSSEGPELSLLEEAEGALAEDDPLLPDVLRAHALWLLASAPERAPLMHLSRRSLALARAARDEKVLARATATRLTLLNMPDEAEERLALASELLEQAEALADDDLAATAQRHRGWALLDRGAYAASTAAYEAHRELALRTRQPMALATQAAIDVMTAALDGRYDDAEDLQEGFERVSQRFPASNSGRWAPFASKLVLRWMQGRLAELEETTVTMARALPQLHVLHAVHAQAAAEAGHLDEARASLVAAAPRGYGALPENLFWTGMVFHLAEAARRIGDAQGAEQLYAALRPHGDRNLTLSGRVFLGSAAYQLGRLAATAGRTADARAHLEDAVRRHAALRSPPWVELAESALDDLEASGPR